MRPYKYMGGCSPKESKNRQKVKKFSWVWLVLITLFCRNCVLERCESTALNANTKKARGWKVRKWLSHARVARAFQQWCCFFAVTSVTRGVNLGGKTVYFLDNGEEKQNLFRCLLLYIFCTWITNLLKFIQTDTISSWNTMGYYIPCDTCDSKNAKTPVRRARTRAWEEGVLEKFALSKSKIVREGKMIKMRSATSGKIFLLRCWIL